MKNLFILFLIETFLFLKYCFFCIQFISTIFHNYWCISFFPTFFSRTSDVKFAKIHSIQQKFCKKAKSFCNLFSLSSSKLHHQPVYRLCFTGQDLIYWQQQSPLDYLHSFYEFNSTNKRYCYFFSFWQYRTQLQLYQNLNIKINKLL